jgi:hypothetical protein
MSSEAKQEHDEPQCLQESQIIERNCPVPPSRLGNEEWPENSPQIDVLAHMFQNEDHLRIFLFNKVNSNQRICPACMTRYKLSKHPKYKIEIEQEASGICSFKCFAKMTGPDGGYDIVEDLAVHDALVVNDEEDSKPVEIIKVPRI